tara:strand:- start:4589 stop:5950 length:1362 start_codon:yes stop_codon:yes gene_type:complete
MNIINNDLNRLIAWLNIILHERISDQIFLSLNNSENKKWIISTNSSSKKIYIDYNPNLYIVGYQPNLPCSEIKLDNKFFKSIYNNLPSPGNRIIRKEIISYSQSDYYLNYDILGLIFWMLSRAEEIKPLKFLLDKHNRFDYRFSHAYLNGYLSRPIVDEWILFLGELIEYVFKDIKVRRDNYRICPTHDVDRPRKFSLISKQRLIKNFTESIIEEPNIILNYFSNKLRIKSKYKDPYNTFDWILDLSNKYNLINEFYFMTSHNNWRYDTGYNINHPIMLDLLNKVSEKGHIIGLHPSYSSTNNPSYFISQANKFKALLIKQNIKQKRLGGRMHYLRFNHPETAYTWNYAGFSYDSSLGYASSPGFRCGTCKEYPLFDPISFNILDLRERPLILMDVSLEEQYVNSNLLDSSLECVDNLKRSCKKVSGNFTFLWHNCNLESDINRRLYEHIISN